MLVALPMRPPYRTLVSFVALVVPACAPESDPAPVEIPAAVQRAFDARCVTDGCHDATTRAGGLSLDALDSPRIVGGASAQSPLPLVRIGDLGGSYLAIKLLPDDQLPAGAVRFEDRMPRDGVEAEDVDDVNTILAWIAGFGPSASDGGELTTTSSGTAEGSGSGASGDGDSTTTTGQDPSGPGPTTNSGGGPTLPGCHVEEVTEGAVADPLDKGDVAGKIPQLVGVVIEERCGCHTLADRTLNTKFPALLAPANTLLLAYDDLSRPIGGSTLGARMQSSVFGAMSMPPGSCPSIPADDLAVLEKWFLDGRPDGADFEPP